MSRVEFLKKFVAFNKKYKVPTPITKLELYLILIVCFIHYAIVKGIRTIKNIICSPFIKLRLYLKKNIRTVFQIECIVATIGICFLVISEHGSIKINENNTGALAGETYAEGDFMGSDSDSDNDSNSNNIPGATIGNISNSDKDNIQSDDTTEIVEKPNDEMIGGNETHTDTIVASSHPYKIMVNRLKNCITIYILDENNEYTVPYKAMICSTGGSNTPLGSFKISSKYDFKELFYKSYGQYCSRIYGHILFHSSGNNSLNKDDLNASDYNRLGEGVSHGCIRLTVEDAKWIYDNCPSGTQVVVYDDENPGPLGKPESIKVPLDTVWDPTDPDENNPWHKEQPRIEGVVERVFYENDVVDCMEGIKAYDTCGNDITEDVVVEGTVDINMPGYYTVKYTVTDLLGKSAELSVIYTVR